MSTSLARLRRALPVIVAAHAVKTLFALGLLGGFGSALATASETGAPSAGPAWLIALGLRSLPLWSAGAQWLVLLYLLVTPLLTQLVLAALARPSSLAAALGAARPRYACALLHALCGHVALGLVAFAGYAGAEQLPALVPSAPIYEESVRFASIALALLAALYTSTATDLAAARLALEPASFLTTIRAALRTTRARTLLVHAGLIAAGSTVYALGDLLVRDAAWPALALATQQTLALASSAVRALWLARALDAISPYEPAHTSRP